jgi:hypothetical protein
MASVALMPNSTMSPEAIHYMTRVETQNYFFQVFWTYWKDGDFDTMIDPFHETAIGRAAVAMGLGRVALDNLEDLVEGFEKAPCFLV